MLCVGLMLMFFWGVFFVSCDLAVVFCSALFMYIAVFYFLKPTAHGI